MRNLKAKKAKIQAKLNRMYRVVAEKRVNDKIQKVKGLMEEILDDLGPVSEAKAEKLYAKLRKNVERYL